MQIRVIGSNIEVGESLTNFTKEHLEKMVTKFFEKAVGSEVHYKKEGNLFKVLLIVNEGVKKGIFVKSDGEAGDAFGAFNEALKKAEAQLRRYRNRIKDYRAKGGGLKSQQDLEKNFSATKYILPPLAYNVFNEMEEESSNDSNNNHKIIEEKETQIETLDIEDAIMKMDLANLPALVFINKQNNRLNVVYHRKDGLISHIDPQL
jgi:ribosomal subunit interface protein